MKQTLLEPIKYHICRLCDEDYSIYGSEDRICDDCDIGINNGQWVWDKIAQGYE